MNENNEVKFTFKAEIQNLEQGIQQAKQSLQELKQTSEGMSNFTVNWGEGSGTVEQWEAYRQEAERTAESVAQTAQAMNEYATSASESANSTGEYAESVSEAGDLTDTFLGKLVQLYNTVADSVSGAFINAKDAVEGFVMRMDEATMQSTLLQTSTRSARLAILALATAITAYAKSGLDELTEASSEYAATQESIESSLSQLKLTFAQVLQPLMEWVSGLFQWLAANKELVAVLTSVVAGIAAVQAAIAALGTVISVVKGATTGWIGALSILAGVAAGAYASTLTLGSGINYDYEKTAELSEEIADLDSQIAEAEASAASAGATASNTIDDVNKQLAKLEKNFRQSLKQIAVNHEQTIEDLTTQIEEANFEYQRAIDERNAAFAVSQAEEAEAHQDKVDELMTQIQFLQKYNNKANQEKLQQLQFALAKEENYYKQQTEAEKAELDLQNENDRIAYEEKLANLQAELDDELAFQEKHREALQTVRDEILLDEVESLQAQYEEQKASYEDQIALAGVSGTAAGDAFSDATLAELKARRDELQAEYDELLNADSAAAESGASAGRNWFENFANTGNKFLKEQGIFSGVWQWFDDVFYNIGTALGGYASGGYTGSGNVNEVAGVVHKGEYVLPQEMVDQTTGTPKSLGQQFITINVNGTFATSAVERRKVAEQIADALAQTTSARLGA